MTLQRLVEARSQGVRVAKEGVQMGKKVLELMTARPRCVTPETPVGEAAEIMREEDVGSLPIVANEGRLIGMVTDRDLAIRVLGAGLDPLQATVGQVASNGVVAVGAEDDIEDALVLMAQYQLQRLPVVSDDQIVGILSQADVALEARERTIGEVVAEISRPPEGPRV